MTYGLRKVHKFIWLLIFIIGTVFLFVTVSELKFPTEKKELVETLRASSSQTAENDWFKITLKEDQIRLILKKSLKASSAVVYGILKNDEKGNVIGQLSAVGTYKFDITEPIEGVLIVDEIKHVELIKLRF